MTATRINPTVETSVVDGWTVRRFPDGYTEVRKTVTKQLSYVAWGSWYEAKICDPQNYPFEFADLPSFRVELNTASGGSAAVVLAELVLGGKSVTPTVYCIRPNNASTYISVSLIATGIEA